MNKYLIMKISVMVVFSVIIAVYFSLLAPFNMDEFVQYHGIICHEYPLNKLNVFNESCSKYDLAIFDNVFMPLRSYEYIGNFLGILYYPLLKLWPSPNSARFFGLMMLVIQAFFIYRTFRIDIIIAWSILVLFMPYAFQHVVDTGPVAFQTTSIIFICYLAQKWVVLIESGWSKYSWLYPLLIGIVIFLGIWVKLFYIILIPAILAMILYFFVIKKKFWITTNLKTIIRDTALLVVAATLPTFTLLSATDRGGNKYFKVLTDADSTPFANTDALKEHFFNLSKYFTNPLQTTHRIFEVTQSVTLDGILLVGLVLSFIAISIWRIYSEKKEIRFIVLNITLFIATLFIMLYIQKVWAMHHVILAVPFLILAIFSIISQLNKRKILLIYFIFFICVNIHLYYFINKQTPLPYCHPSLVKINEQLNKHFSNDYIFVVVNWGMYYLKGLYGNKNQCVLFMEPFDETNALFLQELKATTKRKIMIIGRADFLYNPSRLKYYFPNITELGFGFDTGSWRAWYEL